ncbi:hypothetical protein OUZ56_018665 [Daphnia magna]|uniref:Uncharacterized protein n=1 Tax=Daphnia magna TaxID=35525 RepID=A0ABQ9Z9I0_9CRUS|nr:hypothetical protein OUZ56_018665 [Daphnia magna]
MFPATGRGTPPDLLVGMAEYADWLHLRHSVPTTSVRKCADIRKPPCKYLADLRDVFVKKKSELYKPPLRLYTTFQKY